MPVGVVAHGTLGFVVRPDRWNAGGWIAVSPASFPAVAVGAVAEIDRAAAPAEIALVAGAAAGPAVSFDQTDRTAVVVAADWIAGHPIAVGAAAGPAVYSGRFDRIVAVAVVAGTVPAEIVLGWAETGQFPGPAVVVGLVGVVVLGTVVNGAHQPFPGPRLDLLCPATLVPDSGAVVQPTEIPGAVAVAVAVVAVAVAVAIDVVVVVLPPVGCPAVIAAGPVGPVGSVSFDSC